MELQSFSTPESVAYELYLYATENNCPVNVVVNEDHSVHLVERATTGANFFTVFHVGSTYEEYLEAVLADWSDFQDYLEQSLEAWEQAEWLEVEVLHTPVYLQEYLEEESQRLRSN